uniref:Uncharacterized protein n=1 Tax=Oryza sativa subsp. japonica TaxID=39947 RepID=Q6YTK2_ORYSJ|nr:hypothetical protein [Oryza sativa Japonica Group]
MEGEAYQEGNVDDHLEDTQDVLMDVKMVFEHPADFQTHESGGQKESELMETNMECNGFLGELAEAKLDVDVEMVEADKSSCIALIDMAVD